MNRRVVASVALIGSAVIVIAYSVHAQRSALPLAAATTVAAADDADREAIQKAARSFAEGFNKGDAKAAAAQWTENGESRDASGQTFAGRAAIEKTLAESFKKNPGLKVEVLVKSVRFPAKDMAVEEGLLRYSRGSKDLPFTTTYVAVHAREDGQWKIALSSEHGVGQDRLEDLDWLLGEWTTKVKEDAVMFSFARDPKKAMITGTFTRSAKGKDPISGSIRIAVDPETGSIRSWGFEDDGAHSQSIWHCDGKSWMLDMRGVLADGTPTEERIVLQRTGVDAITWRAIDRVLGNEALPDTQPMRLTRASKSK